MKTSVALCTYNGEQYLSTQLESIFLQSHPVDEIVVCDDGSTDGTLAILEDFHRQHPDKLKIYRNGQNLGGRKNFDNCFNLCTGDVIFFCDQDDAWHPDKVQKNLTAFQQDENCWCIATDARLMGGNGEDLEKGFWESFDFCAGEVEGIDAPQLYEFVLQHHNMIAGAMMAVKKEAKPYIYPFRFPQNIWHDEWITIVLSCMGKMKLLEEKLVNYRLHSGQQMGVGNQSADLVTWVNKLKRQDELRADPAFYLSHALYTYQKLQHFKNALPFTQLTTLQNTLHQRLQDAKQIFLKRHGFLQRKGRLLKWRMEGRYITSWKDVITM